MDTVSFDVTYQQTGPLPAKVTQKLRIQTSNLKNGDVTLYPNYIRCALLTTSPPGLTAGGSKTALNHHH